MIDFIFAVVTCLALTALFIGIIIAGAVLMRPPR